MPRCIRAPVSMAVLWSFLASACLGANKIIPTDYSFDTWQIEDGLPYNSVTAIVQTRDGYLWLGTYNGLARFDGVHFTSFDHGNTPEMSSPRVTSLFEDKEHSLWIGHETGELGRLFNGKFNAVKLGGGWPGGEILDMNTDSAGDLWLHNKNGWLYRLRDEHSIPAGSGAENGAKMIELIKEQGGRLWAIGDTMLGWLDNGEFVPWPGNGDQKTNFVQRACASSGGGLWVIANSRIRKCDSHGWTKDVGPVPWGPNTPMAMLETRNGMLLVGTLEAGVFLIAPDGSSQHFSRQNGLSHDWVRCVCEDLEGNLWIGTGGGGLAALRVRTVKMVRVPDDWQGKRVQSLTPSADGGLWVGTEGAGLYRLAGEYPTQYMMTNGLWNAYLWSVLEDSKKRLWVGSWGSGLYTNDGNNFQQPAGVNPNGIITALYEGRGGVIWLGTAEGLGRYSNGTYTWFTNQDGVTVREVRAIAEEPSGTVWFGMMNGGLGKLEKGRLSQFRMEDGLPWKDVWSLLVDDEGALWIGTDGGGLCRLKQGRFATISGRDGLPNNVICHMADDGRGNFWISTYGGIFRVRKSDLRQCADGSGKPVVCFTYGKADGVSILECSGGSQPTGCQTPDGRLWFPTAKGLVLVDPANVKMNPLPPPTIIEEVYVDGNPVALPHSIRRSSDPFQLEIQPGNHNLEIHFTGLSFVAPEKVRFQYRLEGLEEDWSKPSTAREASYNPLKPGRFTFRVKACNADGVWDDFGASLSVRVLPYFWQTWWFSAAAIVAGGGSVGGVVRYVTRRRLRRKMEKLERQRAIEKERTRIAKDIHDDLGASLTRITLLSQSGRMDHDDPQQAAADLDQIYNTARELTRAMDEIVWAVSPQHDTLDSLVAYLGKFAQDFLSVAAVRCRLNVPIQLPAWPLTAEVRHNIFLAFKEVLNNVLKHASATEVRISLELVESGFCLVIEDNGKGFDPATVAVKDAASLGDHGLRLSSGNGLVNIKRRLEEIGGTFELKSAPGEGTHVKFAVKVKSETVS